MHFVSTNIKYLRKKHNLSQCQLADKIGLKRGNIASYEKSIAEPKILNLRKLANYFNVTISDLVTIDLTSDIPKEDTSLNSEPILVEDEFSKIKAQCEEFDSMLKGMHCYHSFRMKQISEESDDIKMLSNEVEKLLEVAKSLMDSHKYLLQVIENHDNCD